MDLLSGIGDSNGRELRTNSRSRPKSRQSGEIPGTSAWYSRRKSESRTASTARNRVSLPSPSGPIPPIGASPAPAAAAGGPGRFGDGDGAFRSRAGPGFSARCTARGASSKSAVAPWCLLAQPTEASHRADIRWGASTVCRFSRCSLVAAEPPPLAPGDKYSPVSAECPELNDKATVSPRTGTATSSTTVSTASGRFTRSARCPGALRTAPITPSIASPSADCSCPLPVAADANVWTAAQASCPSEITTESGGTGQPSAAWAAEPVNKPTIVKTANRKTATSRNLIREIRRNEGSRNGSRVSRVKAIACWKISPPKGP